jgi:hypothetical protein
VAVTDAGGAVHYEVTGMTLQRALFAGAISVALIRAGAQPARDNDEARVLPALTRVRLPAPRS